jgi:hypothetical protein
MDILLLAEDLSFPFSMPGNHVVVEDEDFVVGQWKKSLEEEKAAAGDDDEDDDNHSDMMEMDEILEIDRQIGARFLDIDLFGEALCESPLGPVEELFQFEREDDHQQLLAPFLPDDFMTDEEEDSDSLEVDQTVGLSFEERYKATLQKLAFSMKKSQETRKSLTMQTAKTEKYDRLTTVKKILSSVATSSDQVQNYVTSLHRQC